MMEKLDPWKEYTNKEYTNKEHTGREQSSPNPLAVGEVYLVGAGPGDRDLITRKALHCLRSCHAVVYDYLASHDLLEETSPSCQRIYVGKKAGFHSMKQEEINGILIKLAKEGKIVVRLKGGDPMVFGRGGEEALALSANGIPFEVVPGVTSVTAALAAAGIPVTHRGISRSFHVMTGHVMGEEGGLPKQFQTFAKLDGTLIFLMGLQHIDLIVEGLLKSGKNPATPGALIENGSLGNQRVLRGRLETLPSLAKEHGIHSPAMIVVGEVAAMNLESTLERPLKGLCFGLTGTKSFVGRISEKLRALGGDTRYLFRMEAVTSEEDQELKKAISSLNQYTWLVFTSANGVGIFFQRLWEYGMDYRALGHIKIAVIGPGTALELERRGLRYDFMPKEYASAALGRELAEILKKTDRLLIPRAAKGSRELTEIFSAEEISYTDMILYHMGNTIRNSQESDSSYGPCDFLVFGSSSGVDAYYQFPGQETGGNRPVKIACIGGITAKTLSRYGRVPDVTAKQFDADGLAESIVDYVRKNKGLLWEELEHEQGRK